MIRATMFDTVLEVEVSASGMEEFYAELEKVRDAISKADREWDPDRKVWRVHNVEKYREVPFVRKALENRQRQPKLF
jgi:hypothetical protein